MKRYISEIAPANVPALKYDSEAGLFCVYSQELDKLKILAAEFKAFCDNPERLKGLISRSDFRMN